MNYDTLRSVQVILNYHFQYFYTRAFEKNDVLIKLG